MANLDILYRERASLRLQMQGLQDQLSALNTQYKQVGDQIDRINFPCTCVRLNRDLGIYDNVGLVNARRNDLDIGLIAEQLSADLDCPLCHGTGVPGVHKTSL